MARRNMKSAPKSSRKKSWVHTFYLVQPVMQFLALVATLVLFARCSPLASSTDKSSTLQLNATTGNRTTPQAEEAAQEEAIQKSLQELTQDDIGVISVDDMKKLPLEIEKTYLANKSQVETSFDRKSEMKKYKGAIIALHIEMKDAKDLFLGADLRIPLHDLVKYKDEDTLNHFLSRLEESHQKDGLKAKIYLTAPENALQQQPDLQDIKMPFIASLGFPSDNQGFIEIKLRPQTASEKDANAALLLAGESHWNTLSIILE